METQSNRPQAAWRGLVAIAAVIVIIAGMRAAADLIVPFLLAVSIAIIFLPPLSWMRRHHVPTAAAIVIVFLLIIIAISGVGALIGNSITNIVQDLPQYQNQFRDVLQQVLSFARSFGVDISLASIQAQLNPNNALTFVTRFFQSFASVLGSSFLIVFTVIFLLFEACVLPRKLHHMATTARSRGSVDFSRSFADSVQRYVFLKTAFSLVLGVVVALVLWALGVRYAPLWGLLAFLLNFVPNIGAFLSAIPPVLLALLQGGWPLFAYTAGILFVIHFITGNFIEPIFMGESLGLSTLVVFVSLVFWGWILGPVGMLLSVPLTMIIRIGFESSPDTRWVATLLGPPPRSNEKGLFLGWAKRLMPKSAHKR
ncbi:MAG: AI-2E family transporter [Gammaproteobacteria bacterium]|nr:AI-2E family transporter [Gammaproteobacteria bacterium]